MFAPYEHLEQFPLFPVGRAHGVLNLGQRDLLFLLVLERVEYELGEVQGERVHELVVLGKHL